MADTLKHSQQEHKRLLSIAAAARHAGHNCEGWRKAAVSNIAQRGKSVLKRVTGGRKNGDVFFNPLTKRRYTKSILKTFCRHMGELNIRIFEICICNDAFEPRSEFG